MPSIKNENDLRKLGLKTDPCNPKKLIPLDKSPPKGHDQTEIVCPRCGEPIDIHCQACGYQFNRKEKQQIIDSAIQEAQDDPDRPNSNRAIAKSLNGLLVVDHTTVGRRRKKLQSTGALPQLKENMGLDGRVRRTNPQRIDRDKTPTPPSVCYWIWETITKAGCGPQIILDPCAGNGNLTKPFREADASVKVIEYEIDRGIDFFARNEHIECDLALVNPPFSNFYEWLIHTVKVVGRQTPLVFITPSILLQGYRSGKYDKYLRSPACPKLTAVTILPKDIFVGVSADTVIAWFTFSDLKDVALIPSEYLVRSNKPFELPKKPCLVD